MDAYGLLLFLFLLALLQNPKTQYRNSPNFPRQWIKSPCPLPVPTLFLPSSGFHRLGLRLVIRPIGPFGRSNMSPPDLFYCSVKKFPTILCQGFLIPCFFSIEILRYIFLIRPKIIFNIYLSKPLRPQVSFVRFSWWPQRQCIVYVMITLRRILN